MARVQEQRLVCPSCERHQELPACCGTAMEFDGQCFFCSHCDRELKMPVCCGRPMQIQELLRDLKKEFFGTRL